MNLAELIATHKGDRSYETLAKACGGSPGAARLQQLATQPQKNFPDPPTISALSRGLRVPAVAIVLASAESLGIDIRRATPALLDRLPRGVEDLRDDQLRTVVELVNSFVRANESVRTQRYMLERLLVDSGVVFRDTSGKRLDPSIGVPQFIDQMVNIEHDYPGSVNDLYEVLSRSVEHARTHTGVEHEVTVTVGEDAQDGTLIQILHPDTADERFLERREEFGLAARGEDDGSGPKNQSERP